MVEFLKSLILLICILMTTAAVDGGNNIFYFERGLHYVEKIVFFGSIKFFCVGDAAKCVWVCAKN